MGARGKVVESEGRGRGEWKGEGGERERGRGKGERESMSQPEVTLFEDHGFAIHGLPPGVFSDASEDDDDGKGEAFSDASEDDDDGEELVFVLRDGKW
eukprot:COSAG02_NODE_2372_length_9029_cov_5.008735_2_plen_98_part_00